MPKVSEYIADVLAVEQVPAVFELVGGMITHMLDAIHLRGVTPIISMRHEQGAAFAAEGCSRLAGRPAVAMATSGPGATNLLTGVASCYFDSTPSVFITGQVNTNEQKGELNVRQLGFQETDIVSMASAVTKKAWRIEHEDQIVQVFQDAFKLAVNGRPGPVLIDIPMNVQRAQIIEHAIAVNNESRLSISNPIDTDALIASLLKAKKPLILAGGGIRSGNAAQLFRSFAELANVPVVHSLMGVDILPYDHPLNKGMIGSYGNRWANLSLAECDWLLVLGSRLDVRQTGGNTEAFKGQREIYHIDCEPAEMNNRIKGCKTIVSEIAPALASLIEAFNIISADLAVRFSAWLSYIDALRLRWPDISELDSSIGINPNIFMHELSRHFSRVSAYVTDVGQHQMWAAQSLELHSGERFLTSGGMGSMGFGLPAAIGAAIAQREHPTVLIAGDGGFQCNIQELETVANLQLPIKIVIINNQCHGMVRQFQESYFESRFQSTVWGYSAPDFARVAEAYQIPARTIDDPKEVMSGADWLASQSRGPSLLQVMVPQSHNAYPKLAFGHALDSMEPFVKPLDMEST